MQTLNLISMNANKKNCNYENFEELTTFQLFRIRGGGGGSDPDDGGGISGNSRPKPDGDTKPK
jgi:hypothetical protein